MELRVWQGILCFLVALPNYVTTAPTATEVTSQKGTKEPVTSSKGRDDTPTTIPAVEDISTVISTVTASKKKLYGKLRQIKIKEAEIRKKLDNNSDILGGELHTIKAITQSSTEVTSRNADPSITTTSKSKGKKKVDEGKPTSQPTTQKKPEQSSFAKTEDLSSVVPSKQPSMTSPMTSSTPLSSNAVTSPETATMTSANTSEADQKNATSAPNNQENGDEEEDDDDDYNDDDDDVGEANDGFNYEEDYDEGEDWFKTNDMIWDFDDDKRSEEDQQYNELFDPGSGDKFQQFFMSEIKVKPPRLPWV